MIFIITNFINGLSLGGVYALIALGYTMVYGIAKMLNFAHGDIIMVGGYTIMVFLNMIGLSIPAIIISIAPVFKFWINASQAKALISNSNPNSSAMIFAT